MIIKCKDKLPSFTGKYTTDIGALDFISRKYRHTTEGTWYRKIRDGIYDPLVFPKWWIEEDDL